MQEDNLDVTQILGLLYENNLINRQLRQDIENETSPLQKRRLLLNQLEKLDDQKLLVYCEVLEKSYEKDINCWHKKIAEEIKSKLTSYTEEAFRMLNHLYMTYSTTHHGDHQFATSKPLSSFCLPPRIGHSGALKSHYFSEFFRKFWDLHSTDVQKSMTLVSELQYLDIPPDLKAGLMQAGAGFERESIPLLQHALAISKQAENTPVLECRIHWQLMWCYDRIGDTTERDRHLELAFARGETIGPDFSAAFIKAWKAYVLMYTKRSGATLEMEPMISHLLDTAYQFIHGCSEMRWFVEAICLYKADWHLAMCRAHMNANNANGVKAQKHSMSICLQNFETPPGDHVQFAQNVERIFNHICEESLSHTTRSQFGRYACQLYLKFGQFKRAKRVMHLVGNEALVQCIDEVQAAVTCH